MISFRSKITQQVLSYFMLHDYSEKHVNGLSRQLDLDSGNLTRQLDKLEKEGILKSRWEGCQRLYSLNKSFFLYREYKKIILNTFGIEEKLRNMIKEISGINQVIIFGSYVTNKMDQQSDIDVLVVGGFNTIELNRWIAHLQKNIERVINCVNITQDEYDQKKNKDPFFKSILNEKHIIL